MKVVHELQPINKKLTKKRDEIQKKLMTNGIKKILKG